MATPDGRTGGGKPSPLILSIAGCVLVLGLLVGWIVGHYAGSSSTKTVTEAASPRDCGVDRRKHRTSPQPI